LLGSRFCGAPTIAVRTFFAQTTVQAANGGDRPEASVIWIAETDYRNFDLKTENKPQKFALSKQGVGIPYIF